MERVLVMYDSHDKLHNELLLYLQAQPAKRSASAAQPYRFAGLRTLSAYPKIPLWRGEKACNALTVFVSGFKSKLA
jgi:hypothetical protein